jgi:hypothetical protein
MTVPGSMPWPDGRMSCTSRPLGTTPDITLDITPEITPDITLASAEMSGQTASVG